MPKVLKIPLLLTSQPDGGYIVTSPVLPELLTEGDSLEEAIGNVNDALAAVMEIYEDLGKQFPANLRQDPQTSPIWFEGVVASK